MADRAMDGTAGPGSEAEPEPAGLPPDPRLRDRLDRWVAHGLIEVAQADRIMAAEAGPDVSAPPGRRERVGAAVVAEALGYVGAALAVVAAVLALRDLWSDVGTAGQIAAAAAGALVLLAAGIAVGTERARREPALARLRAVLWLLSTGCLVEAQMLVGDQVWEWSGPAIGIAAYAAGTGYGLVLWTRSVTAPQQLAVFLTATGLVASSLHALGAGLGGVGTGVWALSAAWGLAAYAGLLAPRRAGLVLAALGLIAGGQLVMVSPAGDLLGLLTVALLVVAGVAMRAVWLLALGAADVAVAVPRAAADYLPQTAAAPIAIFVVGVTLVAIGLWQARAGRRGGLRPG